METERVWRGKDHLLSDRQEETKEGRQEEKGAILEGEENLGKRERESVCVCPSFFFLRRLGFFYVRQQKPNHQDLFFANQPNPNRLSYAARVSVSKVGKTQEVPSFSRKRKAPEKQTNQKEVCIETFSQKDDVVSKEDAPKKQEKQGVETDAIWD